MPVHAERVGFRGYGMMLAEVGLPPGADVDRPSLDSAVSASGWDLQSYEVQPDRVVFYLWPRAGGTTFSFTFKPRFGITVQSSESVLYDYYNPEARASVPPARFKVEGTALPDEVKNIGAFGEGTAPGSRFSKDVRQNRAEKCARLTTEHWARVACGREGIKRLRFQSCPFPSQCLNSNNACVICSASPSTHSLKA